MESLLPVAVTELIGAVLEWPQLIAKLSCNPARILDIPGGTLRPGCPADVTIIDPDVSWTIDAARFKSKSRNCPFHGKTVRGRAMMTIVGGATKYIAP